MSNPLFFGIGESYPVISGSSIITDKDGNTVFPDVRFIFFPKTNEDTTDVSPKIAYVEPLPKPYASFLEFGTTESGGTPLYTNVKYVVNKAGSPSFPNDTLLFFGIDNGTIGVSEGPSGLTQNYDFLSPIVDEDNPNAAPVIEEPVVPPLPVDYWELQNPTETGRFGHSAVEMNDKLYIYAGVLVGQTRLNDLKSYDPKTTLWTTLKPDIARSFHSATTYHNKMYVFGGYNGSSYVRDMRRYDPATDTWESLASAPAGNERAGHNSVLVGTKIYIYGGYSASSSGFPALICYDILLNRWTVPVQETVKHTNHATAAVLTKIYAYGGTLNGVAYSDQLRCYDTVTETWTTLSPGTPREFHSAIAIEDVIYFYGGGTSSTDLLNDLQAYNTVDDTWVKKTDGPLARINHSAINIHGDIYIYGGRNSAGATLSDLWRYVASRTYGEPKPDPVDTWTPVSQGPILGTGYVSVTIDGKVYIFGGKSVDGTVYKELWRYEPVSKRWTKMADGIIGLHGASSSVVAGKLYITGGRSQDGTIQDTIYRYDPQTNKWSVVTTMPNPVYGGKTVVIDGKIYTLGGSDNSGFIDDIWVYDPVTDSWKQLANNQYVSSGQGYAAVGDKIYSYGGSIGGNPTNTLRYYNSITNRWVTIGGGPVSMSDHTMVVVGDHIYFYGGGSNYKYNTLTGVWTGLSGGGGGIGGSGGGHTGTAVGGKIYYYDKSGAVYEYIAEPSEGNWSGGPVTVEREVVVVDKWNPPAVDNRPPLRNDHAATVANGRMYIYGGIANEGSGRLNDMHCFDPNYMRWFKLTDGPSIARSGHTIVNIGSKIYAHGGDSDFGYVNDVHEYDTGSGTWRTLAGAPISRANHTAVALDGLMYVYGGRSANGLLNDLRVYDPVAGTWEQLSDGPSARYQHTCVPMNGKLYVFGGAANIGATVRLNDLSCYDPATNTWETLKAGHARCEHSATVINGKMYVHGGNDASSLNDLRVYDPVTDQWKGLASAPFARWKHSAVTLNGKMFVYGGYTTGAGSDLMDYIDEELFAEVRNRGYVQGG